MCMSGGQNCTWDSMIARIGSKVESRIAFKGSSVHQERGNDSSPPVSLLIHHQECHS